MPKVGFTITEDERNNLLLVAQKRGFANIGTMARFALKQYAARYPGKGMTCQN